MKRYNIGDTATLKVLHSITDSKGTDWELLPGQFFALDQSSHALHIVNKDFDKIRGFKRITGFTLSTNIRAYYYANGPYGVLNALNELINGK